MATAKPAAPKAEDYPMGKPLPPDQDPSFHVEAWPEAYNPVPAEGAPPADSGTSSS